MKKLRKVLALVLAMVMVLAMGVTASAARITINPNTPATGVESNAPEYTYYVMMKASVGTGTAAYYVEDQTKATALDNLTVDGKDLFTVTKASGADRWNVVLNKKSETESFSGEEIAAALYTIKDNAIATGTATDNTIDIAGDGYVLVESSLGTKFIADTLTTKTINEKNFYPSNTKSENKQNEEIGGVVTYTVNVVIPQTVSEKTITVYDTISYGLTLNTAATVSGGVNNPAYTSATWAKNNSYTASGNEKQYTITIPANVVKANAGRTLTFTYNATINENAVVNVAETNKAHIKYDNFTTSDVEVQVKTFGFELAKVNGNNKALAGVKFILTNADGEYYTPATNNQNVDEDRFPASKTKVEVSTDSNGKIVFAGLKQGTYTLTETETLAGYNLLTGSITVTINENGEATFEGATGNGNTVTVVNNTGSTLPSTGGMGTTLFYVFGAVLVIGAGIVLVARRRMAK